MAFKPNGKPKEARVKPEDNPMGSYTTPMFEPLPDATAKETIIVETAHTHDEHLRGVDLGPIGSEATKKAFDAFEITNVDGVLATLGSE